MISNLSHRIGKAVWLYILAAFWLLPAYTGALPGRQDVHAIIIDKTFPFYGYVAHNNAYADIVRNDKTFQKQNQRQSRRIAAALEQCRDVACYAAAVQWSPREISNIGKRMAQLCQKNKAMHPLPALLRSKGHYPRYITQKEPALVKSAWKDAALGVNGILDTYVKGKKPRYPAIDSISFPVDDGGFRDRVHQLLAELMKQQTPEDLFFELPLQFALKALDFNNRDEAARYEPMDREINKATMDSIPGIQWGSFRYSLILVPGKGPEKEDLNIDPMGIKRCMMAAERYEKGLAPLIVVSGGHVHPNQTPYSEAVEMKKYMVQELHIPERAILIEPHARHTTTNLRNTVRMVYRFHIPDAMKILTVTDPSQSAFIPNMKKRFLDELGYIPYRDMKILSEEENEFYPIQDALQSNPLDPLDP
jgi:hypothetical protein